MWFNSSGGGAGTGNPDTSIHSAPGFNDGAWHHVVFTRTQACGALTLYVDGVAVDDGHGGTQPLFAPPGLRLGALQTGGTFYAGSLGDAAVYDTDLPAATVAAHFSARQATP
ncbi:MAG TPA: LamG-like jellyroll fold domain-containing protein [Mycobacterium sp.]|nr:LamG-like jellyroll fold domain-containing protein [Mycobacterium sp.]